MEGRGAADDLVSARVSFLGGVVEIHSWYPGPKDLVPVRVGELAAVAGGRLELFHGHQLVFSEG